MHIQCSCERAQYYSYMYMYGITICNNFQYFLYILGGHKVKPLRLPSSNNLQIKGNNKNFTLCVLYEIVDFHKTIKKEKIIHIAR